MDFYENLIKLWAGKMLKTHVIEFKYEGETITPELFGLYFTNNVLRKALFNVFMVFGHTQQAIEVKLAQQHAPYLDTDKIQSFSQMINQLSPNIMDMDKLFTPLASREIDFVKQLPRQFFAKWVLYTLDSDIPPSAEHLEEILVATV